MKFFFVVLLISLTSHPSFSEVNDIEKSGTMIDLESLSVKYDSKEASIDFTKWNKISEKDGIEIYEKKDAGKDIVKIAKNSLGKISAVNLGNNYYFKDKIYHNFFDMAVVIDKDKCAKQKQKIDKLVECKKLQDEIYELTSDDMQSALTPSSGQLALFPDLGKSIEKWKEMINVHKKNHGSYSKVHSDKDLKDFVYSESPLEYLSKKDRLCDQLNKYMPEEVVKTNVKTNDSTIPK